MDDIERIGREINAENNNEDINVGTFKSSNSFESFISLEEGSDSSGQTLETPQIAEFAQPVQFAQPPQIYQPVPPAQIAQIAQPPQIYQPVQPPQIYQPVQPPQIYQPVPPAQFAQAVQVNNKDRFGHLTGIVIVNVVNGNNEEIGVGKRTELYITNHDPGNKKPLPVGLNFIQTFYDVLTCSMPFKYGIGIVVLNIIINLLFLVLAIINYDSCEISYFPLTLYIICRTALGIMLSVLDIIIYYFDACWNSIIICNRKVFHNNAYGNYAYADLFGFILTLLTPIIDTIVGIIFLVIFQDTCHKLIWVMSLVYTIICCPMRRVTMR